MKTSSLTTIPADYKGWLTRLKSRIQGARQQVLLAANQTQIRLYHEIGREILQQQEQQGWGAKVIDRLSADLREAFPDMRGLSSRNLMLMRKFAQSCPNLQFMQQSPAQTPKIGQQSAAQLLGFEIAQQIAAQLNTSQFAQQSAAQLPATVPIGRQSADQLSGTPVGTLDFF